MRLTKKTVRLHNPFSKNKSRIRINSLPVLGILIVSGLVTFYVYQRAWISEDAFITLRYVSNLLNGFGLVFNPGEYVQGFTHPLWLLLLTFLGLFFPDPIGIAVYTGLLLTFATFVLAGISLYRAGRNPLVSILLLSTLGVISVLSDPWVSFQTSGLENSLSQFLITAIISVRIAFQSNRSRRLIFLCGLLCLCRPDFLWLVAPLAIDRLLQERHEPREMAWDIFALLPVFAWFLFAGFYYGRFLPNTAYAKIGIYPTWWDSINQGFAYLKDWIKYDTLAAGTSVFLLIIAIKSKRYPGSQSIALGILAYAVWIIVIGGDFMRGRFFLPVFSASSFLGTLHLNTQSSELKTRLHRYWGIGLGIISILFWIQQTSPNPGNDISDAGIVNERIYYPGYALEYIKKNHKLKNPYLDLDFTEQLKDFARVCGPITIHNQNPGTLGYLAGPEVRIIDLLGLTDAFIANLSNEYLIDKNPRPGHPIKNIPLDYLISRGDISIIPGWENWIFERDCSILKRFET